MFWVISVYFNIRNTLPKSGTFLLGHPVYAREIKGMPSTNTELILNFMKFQFIKELPASETDLIIL